MAITTLEQLNRVSASSLITGTRQDGTSATTLRVNPIAANLSNTSALTAVTGTGTTATSVFVTPTVTPPILTDQRVSQSAPWVTPPLPPTPDTEPLNNIRANIVGPDSTVLVSSDQGFIPAEVIRGTFTGEVIGSVRADDSTLIVDAATGNITANVADIGTADIGTADIGTASITTLNNVNTAGITTATITTANVTTLNSVSSYLGLVNSGIWNGSTIGLGYGGTGAVTAQGVGGALDNLLPAGEQSGYVLKTSGAGTYFWAAETGGGSTVGTRIDTQRIEYTATASQTLFTGVPTYTPGAGQLRVYISGVRQNPAAYTETSTTSFTLSTGVPVGTSVFAEVDGYVSYPIAASDIAYSPLGGGSISGTTVQAAIQEIDTEKAPLSSPAFTGFVTGTISGMGAGLIGSSQYYRLNATRTGTDATGAQSIFGVGVTLAADTQYEIEMLVPVSRTAGVTSHTISLGFGGTATLNNIAYYCHSHFSTVAFSDVNAGPLVPFVQTAALTQVNAATVSATYYAKYLVKGTVSVANAGTFIPQYSLSAAPGGAYTVAIGAYIRITPLAASGSNISIGTWT